MKFLFAYILVLWCLGRIVAAWLDSEYDDGYSSGIRTGMRLAEISGVHGES